jgi:hypothetical protein
MHAIWAFSEAGKRGVRVPDTLAQTLCDWLTASLQGELRILHVVAVNPHSPFAEDAAPVRVAADTVWAAHNLLTASAQAPANNTLQTHDAPAVRVDIALQQHFVPLLCALQQHIPKIIGQQYKVFHREKEKRVRAAVRACLAVAL